METIPTLAEEHAIQQMMKLMPPWMPHEHQRAACDRLFRGGYRLAADVKWEVSAHLKRAAEQVRRHAPGNPAVESAALGIETVADSILTDALRAAPSRPRTIEDDLVEDAG